MTIAELIAKLADFPPNLDVWLVDEKEGITFPMLGEVRLKPTHRLHSIDGWAREWKPTGENHVELE